MPENATLMDSFFTVSATNDLSDPMSFHIQSSIPPGAPFGINIESMMNYVTLVIFCEYIPPVINTVLVEASTKCQNDVPMQNVTWMSRYKTVLCVMRMSRYKTVLCVTWMSRYKTVLCVTWMSWCKQAVSFCQVLLYYQKRFMHFYKICNMTLVMGCTGTSIPYMSQ